MFKKIIAAFAALLAATAFAAVDANKASQAELEALKGIGPVISSLIISERKKSDFKDWNDMVVRVKGVGEKNATKFSEAGLTVNGATFTGALMAAPKPATKTGKADKPMPAPAPATTAAPAPAPMRAASAAKETASKAPPAVKTGTEKAASGAKPAAATAKETAKEEKDAARTKAEDAKEKRAAKKAEKAAAAASTPVKK